jgi:hypothetical protein
VAEVVTVELKLWRYLSLSPSVDDNYLHDLLNPRIHRSETSMSKILVSLLNTSRWNRGYPLNGNFVCEMSYRFPKHDLEYTHES